MPEFGRDVDVVRAAALARLEAVVQPIEEIEVPSPARGLIYDRKLEQARAHEAGEPGPFPLLEVDVEVEGITLSEAAAGVIAESARMETIAEDLERYRRSKKTQIVAATTVAEILTISDGITAQAVQAALTTP